MNAETLALLAIAAFVAGAINSVAGGGSLISWPAAVAAGLSQVVASATNTVALTPGSLAAAWAYRRELARQARRTLLLCVPAGGGSLLGGVLLHVAPARIFESVVPWLVLGATGVLLFKDVLFARAVAAAKPSPRRTALIAAGVFVVAVYGGYFGAGIGMLTLALLAALEPADLIRMNAAKTVICAAMNGVAAVYFVACGRAHLPAASAMAVGAIAGGYGGAALARRVEEKRVRWTVVAIGVSLTAVLAYRRLR